MESKSLQELVKKLFSDEKSKAEFLSNPDHVLSQYDLTEQEKKAILTTSTKLGLVTGNSTQLETTIGPAGVWY